MFDDIELLFFFVQCVSKPIFNELNRCQDVAVNGGVGHFAVLFTSQQKKSLCEGHWEFPKSPKRWPISPPPGQQTLQEGMADAMLLHLNEQDDPEQEALRPVSPAKVGKVLDPCGFDMMLF